MEEAARIASVSLRPLEGMKAVDVAAAAATGQARDDAALGALLKLCTGWQKPGASLQGQCILVSLTKFEVDVGYHADVIAAFKQMPTKSYGNREIMQLKDNKLDPVFPYFYLRVTSGDKDFLYWSSIQGVQTTKQATM